MWATVNIEIRAAGPADAAAISGCLREAFAPYQSAYTPEAFADTVPTADQMQLRLQRMRVLVATAAGEVVGTVSASVDEQAIPGKQGHLRGMAVLPDWHGTGTAALLLAAIEDWLRTRGCAQVTLDTTEPLKSAIAFYEKHGYHRSGKVSVFFGMPLIEYVKAL
jgi:GNAT superfamily N-acetyltransferase